MFGSNLLNVFGHSPIRPMEQHIDSVHACVIKLMPFFEAVIKEDWVAATDLQRDIVAAKNKADTLKKQIRLHLPNHLFMPIARTDLLELLNMQDKIARTAKHLAGLVLGRKMKIPPVIASRYLQFVDRCIQASAQAKNAINELDELVETGFGRREIKLVGVMIHELDDIEKDTDDLQFQLRQELFIIENTLPPVDVIFLYRMIDGTGELADRAKQVGQKLEMLLAQ